MKRQYGVKVVWEDPIKAGLQEGEESSWFAFDTEEQADQFQTSYAATLGQLAEKMPWLEQTEGFDPGERWKAHNVLGVMRAERWAVEEYTPWERTL